MPSCPPADIDSLVIATRRSALALWQAEHVKNCLRSLYPSLHVELLGMTTQGDRVVDRPLADIGGKGLFIKELEQAMQDGAAHMAVHSLKDVPMELPPGFTMAAIMEREDPRDAVVSNSVRALAELSDGSIVGTSSLRREAQLRERYPKLRVEALRGNVNTRLAKLDQGSYSAIILAAAGLKRLGFEQRIASLLDPEDSLPAIGQGALALECRSDQPEVAALLAPLAHAGTTLSITAERAFGFRLAGSCRTPLAAYAVATAADATGELWLRGLIASRDGRTVLRGERRARVASLDDAAAMGDELGAEFLRRGAAAILAAET